jgi:hypothetical protein
MLFFSIRIFINLVFAFSFQFIVSFFMFLYINIYFYRFSYLTSLDFYPAEFIFLGKRCRSIHLAVLFCVIKG